MEKEDGAVAEGGRPEDHTMRKHSRRAALRNRWGGQTRCDGEAAALFSHVNRFARKNQAAEAERACNPGDQRSHTGCAGCPGVESARWVLLPKVPPCARGGWCCPDRRIYQTG